VLEGQSPAWLLQLPVAGSKPHALCRQLRDLRLSEAVFLGSAKANGALDAAQSAGLRVMGDVKGHVSLSSYLEAGDQTVTV
jgi:hypothetical protein